MFPSRADSNRFRKFTDNSHKGGSVIVIVIISSIVIHLTNRIVVCIVVVGRGIVFESAFFRIGIRMRENSVTMFA